MHQPIPPPDPVLAVAPKCPRCKERPVEAPHTCPYNEEINGDFTSLCDCCEACTHECCMEI